MFTVEWKYPDESWACTVTRCAPALMLRFVETVLVEAFSYFFTPSMKTCTTLIAEEPALAVAEIFTGDETVDPFVGEQMWTVRAVVGAEQVVDVPDTVIEMVFLKTCPILSIPCTVRR
jgi:hypothetical protein